MSQIQWIHLKTPGTLKTCTEFKALEGEQTNKYSQSYWLVPVSDWLDSLIGPSGLLLVVSNQLSIDWSLFLFG
jgi:hypothetical protein